MSLLIILLIVAVLFGGGTYFGGDATRGYAFPGVGFIVILIIILALLGVIHI